MESVVKAVFAPGTYSCLALSRYGLKQWNYGTIMQIEGLDLPPAVEIHFSVQGEDATVRVGTTVDKVTRVAIPERYLEQTREITAHVYLADKEAGETQYTISIPINKRAKPEPFDRPEDAELFREAIAEVNKAADRAETAEEGAGESKENAAQSATAAELSNQSAKEAESNAEKSANASKESATKAAISEKNASLSELNAKESAERASESKESAGKSALSASESASASSLSASAAARSETNAKGSEAAAQLAQEEAEAAERESLSHMGEASKSAESAKESEDAAKRYVEQVSKNAEIADKTLNETITKAAREDANLNQSIAESQKNDEILESTIKNANDTKDAVILSAENAIKAKTEAENMKQQLEEKTSEASNMKGALEEQTNEVAKDSTAEDILNEMKKSEEYLSLIAENAGKAGSLNGFGLNMLEDGSVVLTYSDQETGELLDSAVFGKESTLAELDVALGQMNESLKKIATSEGDV